MKLHITKSKNAESFYIAKSYRDKKTGKTTSKIVKKLGTREELEKKLGKGVDVVAWGKEQAFLLTQQEKENTRKVMVSYDPTSMIKMGIRKCYNGGYLFLQDIYHKLGLHKICEDISYRHNFEYDLNSILSRLIYGRIIHPASKLATLDFADTLLEKRTFDLHQVYRSLDVFYNESDFIQAELYKNSKKLIGRKDKILYYDCTNFFFEIEQEDDLRLYGRSKEHRPNPIVQMGLFMDAEGVPLAFTINPGSTNEQKTLVPLEKTIIDDFKLSKFIVCTDAGLSSAANKIFNSQQERQFITTQSIKQLKAHLKDWALDKQGWMISGSDCVFDLDKLDAYLSSDKIKEEEKRAITERTFYKSRMIKEKVEGQDELFEQRLIVTFSFKYRAYQRSVRQGQIDRALHTMETNKRSLETYNQNDYRRFVTKTAITGTGEVAEKTVYKINEGAIAKEARYDGYYGLATSLDGEDIEGILKVNANRWQIEECFRIMKSEFEARPTYLTRKERICAHFLTCFISLLVYRVVEKKLGGEYSCSQIIDTLKHMDFEEVSGEGYRPLYVRSPLTDSLHEKFGFRTDYEILPNKTMKKIIKMTKQG